MSESTPSPTSAEEANKLLASRITHLETMLQNHGQEPIWESELSNLKHLSVLREALKEVSAYDKDSKFGEGICPYGCDTPSIAASALTASNQLLTQTLS